MNAAVSILVVEDEFLLAMGIEALLTGIGWSVIGHREPSRRATSNALVCASLHKNHAVTRDQLNAKPCRCVI